MVADTGPDMLFLALNWAHAPFAETGPGSHGSPHVKWGVRLTPAVDGYRRLSVSNTCRSFAGLGVPLARLSGLLVQPGRPGPFAGTCKV